ncbi:hypothetical protein [Lacticaseibacillus absianus]|uniref:hypothetical protein n=1 Tax=Lacticaseibacillus absianus TaxID=2729623 RepID=UPI0015CA17E7|nr:hypothetical protein [Lacticaseibacillus absianus]
MKHTTTQKLDGVQIDRYDFTLPGEIFDKYGDREGNAILMGKTDKPQSAYLADILADAIGEGWGDLILLDQGLDFAKGRPGILSLAIERALDHFDLATDADFDLDDTQLVIASDGPAYVKIILGEAYADKYAVEIKTVDF